MPRQQTLHTYLDDDAPHQSALRGIQALARLRSPLSNHIRERANKFISSSTVPAGTAGSPIVLDHLSVEGDNTCSIPIELECAVCRSLLQTPLV